MKKQITIGFVILESCLYVAFMALDLLGYNRQTIALKYAGVLLCVLFAVLCAARGSEARIPVALCFTAAADFFLLVIDRNYLAGILLFLVVQTLYLTYLRQRTGKLWLPFRLFCIALVAVVVCVTDLRSALNLLAGIYFTLLVGNMILSWTQKENVPRLFAAGLTLFICCDLCVGGHALPALIPAGLYAFTRIGMWMFYLPSQVLLALSMWKMEKREKTG